MRANYQNAIRIQLVENWNLDYHLRNYGFSEQAKQRSQANWKASRETIKAQFKWDDNQLDYIEENELFENVIRALIRGESKIEFYSYEVNA